MERTSRPLRFDLPAWGVLVLESHHNRDFSAPLEAHEFWQLFYVFQGAGELRLENRAFSLQSGDAVLLAPTTLHALGDAHQTPLSLYAVNVAATVFAPYPLDLPANRVLRSPNASRFLSDALRRLLWEQTARKPGFETMLCGLSLQLLAKLSRLESAPTPEHAGSHENRVAAYISDLERLFYRTESVDNVAARLGMSRRHFTALFRAQTGSSWLPYLRALRLAHAKTLLKTAPRTVLSVAFECGFEDATAFFRAFKRQTGQSPDQWRRENRS